MSNKLAEIFASKEKQVMNAMQQTPMATMMEQAHARPRADGTAHVDTMAHGPRKIGRKFHSLHHALRDAAAAQTMPLIAELKKSSPSRGVIRQDFSVINLAQDYLSAGATALSILTETEQFHGSMQYLKDVASMTQKPILQKDFIFCDYQIYQAAAHGADAILLILSHLDDKTARQLEKTALTLGLDVLLETHSPDEIARANDMESRLVGVNNRNLKDLTVSLNDGEKMLAMIGKEKLPIAESGLSSPADIKKMWAAGARGFLIGEYFMKQPDVFVACHAMIHSSNPLLFT